MEDTFRNSRPVGEVNRCPLGILGLDEKGLKASQGVEDVALGGVGVLERFKDGLEGAAHKGCGCLRDA